MKTNVCIGILMLSLLFVFSKTQETSCVPSIYPVKGYIILEFGQYSDPVSGEKKFNEGIHIGVKIGSSAIAPADGIVKSVSKKENHGCEVIIDHGCGYITRYAHLMENLEVKEGQEVKRYDIIGFVSDWGSKREPFLYYEIRHNGKPINPIDVIMK